MRTLEKLALGGHDELYERLLQREKELAQARGISDFTPGMRMSGSTPGPHPAMEKEVIKGTGPSTAQKVKHHTVGKVRRLWSQPGKYRWLRRAGLLGGAVGAGLLGKAWIDSAKNDKALKEQAAQLEAYKFGANFDYTPNAPVTPKPAKFPKMPAPMSTSGGMPDVPKPPKNSAKTQAYTGESAEMKVATLLHKVAFLESGAMPWVAGAAGGLGGYYAGKKVIDPILDIGQESLRRKIHIAERIIEGLEKGKKVAPFAGATVGAILLAAIAAKKAKQKERETMERVEAMGGPEREGFSPYDRRYVNDPYAGFYYG